jgi:hypothetical protein
MTSGPHRHGRRDNGLHASEYAVAGDVDPRVGEHLLDVLGLAGIAAYLQPTADLHPVTRTTTLPSRPIDRLYVDREHLAEARRYLDQLGPAALPSAAGGPPEAAVRPDPVAPPPADPTASDPPAGTDPTAPGDDIDEAWAAIVADFDAPSTEPVPPWPVEEDLPDEPDDAVETDPVEPAEPAVVPAERPASDWRQGTAHGDLLDTLGAEEDEGYSPPPPPPIPRPSWYAALAVLAIAAGLLVCIRPDVIGFLGLGEGGALTVGFICLMAGFVTLVIRLRPGNDDSDDNDDGAVV